eukprot:CAMPEP_0194029074 /NCGR_PEP_ID=MMETSP0009_2-20130614/2921_1 /TAXON_ID=210454 /ORGANISM="Grammatophora oceanica, Strain CCMP 410" /LENGTH=396 /DNA_ID=CAMNT_0038668663 /DNA_START=96 /DNA_END=1289 /DNA_ORIENTATION=+
MRHRKTSRSFALLRGSGMSSLLIALSLLALLLICGPYSCDAIPTPKPAKSSSSVKISTKSSSFPRISFDSLLPTPPEVVEQLTKESQATAKSAKLRNVRTRTLSAVVMIGALAAFVKLTGWTELIFFFQAAMYSEATTVAGVSTSPILKWGMCLIYLLVMDGRLLLSTSSSEIAATMVTYLPLATFGMGALGLLAWIAKLNAPTNDIFVFQMSLSEVAACNLAGLVLIGFTSFWIRTLQDYGVSWLLYPALLVIVNDTLAYVFGMLLGRNPLLPTISPKKTWEGFLGATASTLAVAKPLYEAIFLKNAAAAEGATTVPIALCLSLAAYISIVAPFGGFLASVVKRSYGFKDFGSLFPGHGGFVDRLDCQVITAPFVYLLLQAFGVEGVLSGGNGLE